MFKTSIKNTTYGYIEKKQMFGFSIVKKVVTSDLAEYYLFGIKVFTRFLKERVHPDVILSQIVKKMSMVNSVWRNKDTLFYVPYYPRDGIQRYIVDKERYYEEDTLKILDKYIPDDAVIFDCGANIGNHSMYWAKRKNPKAVYAFEPIPETFSILTKNIEINGLDSFVRAYNIGLSDVESAAEVTMYCADNIGATAIGASKRGSLKLIPLDSFEFKEDQLDFMKIDVEGHEILLLNGALKTIEKHKPIIFIESFGENFKHVERLLGNLGYSHVLELGESNHLFIIDSINSRKTIFDQPPQSSRPNPPDGGDDAS